MEDRFNVGLATDSWLDNLDSLVREYWGIGQPHGSADLEEAEIKYRSFLSKATTNLVEAALRLQEPGKTDIKGMLSNFREEGYDLTTDPLVRDFAELEMVRELDGLVADMAERALRLLNYLRRVRSQVAQDYLLRVARCYILGMHPETIVMCGAVLEAALDQFMPIDDKRRTLGMKIGALEREVLVGKSLEAAREINQLRTDAVHLRLERLPADSIEIIELLDEVLSRLEEPDWSP